MKSVEQEVRMKLHLERLELGLRKLGFEPRRADFALSITPLIIERVADKQNQPVEHHPVIRHEVDVQKQFAYRKLPSGIADQRIEHQIVKDPRCKACKQRRSEMYQQAANPIPSLDRITAREPQNQWSQCRPDVRVEQLNGEYPLPADGYIAAAVSEIHLARQERSQYCPRGDYQDRANPTTLQQSASLHFRV